MFSSKYKKSEDYLSILTDRPAFPRVCKSGEQLLKGWLSGDFVGLENRSTNMGKFKPRTSIRLHNRRVSKPLTAFINDRCLSPQLLGESLLTHPLNDQIIPIGEALSHCVKGNRCRLTVCPFCGKAPKKAVGVQIIKDIIGHNEACPSAVRENFFTGETTPVTELDMRWVSFVTINGPECDSIDPEVINSLEDSFRQKIKNFIRNRLFRSAWSGQFEFSLGDEPVLHFHGLILHLGCSKKELARILRQSFIQPRAVSVSEWWTADRFKNKKIAKRLAEGAVRVDDLTLSNSSKYSAKPIPDLPYGLGKDNQKIVHQSTVNDLARWMIQNLTLRGKKFKSSRLKIGVASVPGAVWEKSELVMPDGSRKHFEVMDIARKARKNRNGKHLNRIITGYGRNKRAMKEWFEGLEDTADSFALYDDVTGQMEVDSIGVDDYYRDGEPDCNTGDDSMYDRVDQQGGYTFSAVGEYDWSTMEAGSVEPHAEPDPSRSDELDSPPSHRELPGR